MTILRALRERFSDGVGARVLTWIWVLSWAEHAISSREALPGQLLVAIGAVVVLAWEASQDRTRAWAGVSAGVLGSGALILAAAGQSRESGYLLAWGAAAVVVAYGLRSWPTLATAVVALLCAGLAMVVGEEPPPLLLGTAAQFLVVYLLQSLARTARTLRRTQDELAQGEVDAERERLAIEINTLVGLTLTDVSRQVRQAQAHFTANEPVRTHLAEIDELVERGLQQLTQLSYEPVVDDLDSELRTAHTLCRRLGVEFTESVDAAHESVMPTFALALREATTNMFKHADPTRCTVVVRQVGDEALFSLVNDGVRREPSSVQPGTGQNRMRSQVAAVGGTVVAESLPDGRYRVVVRIPTPVRAPQVERAESLERNSHG